MVNRGDLSTITHVPFRNNFILSNEERQAGIREKLREMELEKWNACCQAVLNSLTHCQVKSYWFGFKKRVLFPSDHTNEVLASGEHNGAIVPSHYKGQRSHSFPLVLPAHAGGLVVTVNNPPDLSVCELVITAGTTSTIKFQYSQGPENLNRLPPESPVERLLEAWHQFLHGHCNSTVHVPTKMIVAQLAMGGAQSLLSHGQ